MYLYSVLLTLVVVSSVQAVEFQIQNKLGGPIWVGILGNNGKPPLANGGFELKQNQMRSVFSDNNWAGRFWARTWCGGNNHCETGDCGNRLECRGNGGAPPVTLVEITLKGHGGLDFYDISLVDGFNVPASIRPLRGSGACKPVGCNVDLNKNCPKDLRVIGKAARYTIGCNSACNKYNTDKYCCRGAFGTPNSCNPKTWASNSASYFKKNCPDAYSYAYDDATSTFTCKAPAYRVTFG